VGGYLRDLLKLNQEQRNFRVMGPDETVSNRLGVLLDVTNRTWIAETLPEDDHLVPDGRWRSSASTCAKVVGRLSAHGMPWPVELLRGLHPHRRLYTFDRRLRSRDCIKVVVASKQSLPQWLDMEPISWNMAKTCPRSVTGCGRTEKRSRSLRLTPVGARSVGVSVGLAAPSDLVETSTSTSPTESAPTKCQLHGAHRQHLALDAWLAIDLFFHSMSCYPKAN
jgi:hypothetical protein